MSPFRCTGTCWCTDKAQSLPGTCSSSHPPATDPVILPRNRAMNTTPRGIARGHKGDVSEGDVSEGDVSEGDVSESDVSKDVGFRVQGSGCRVQSLGFRVYGLGFRVKGLGFGV